MSLYTRTQSALTKIAELIAEAHGELRVLAELEEQVRREVIGGGGVSRRRKGPMPAPESVLAGIAVRRAEVERTRDALYVTLRQFNQALDPQQVSESFGWLRMYGRGRVAHTTYLLACGRAAEQSTADGEAGLCLPTPQKDLALSGRHQ